MDPMTLEQAVEVLNRHSPKHEPWRIETEWEYDYANGTRREVPFAECKGGGRYLSAFEAVAVARAYLERERAHLGAGI